jgi:TPP-dependent pyruvate/acetoin dehydrogenase alpha subunit
MHLHHRPTGFYGETAIVAGGVAWAAGAAWARRLLGSEDIAVAFTGDGAFAQGTTHESLLLARHWQSPCLVVCENNGLAHSMPSRVLFGEYGAIADCVAASGVHARYVDGRRVMNVYRMALDLVSEVRRTGRPAFLECGTYRVRPHSVSDADYRYRPKTAGEDWLSANDPIELLRRDLLPFLGARLSEVDQEVAGEIGSAWDAAESLEATPMKNALTDLYASDAWNRDA